MTTLKATFDPFVGTLTTTNMASYGSLQWLRIFSTTLAQKYKIWRLKLPKWTKYLLNTNIMAYLGVSGSMQEDFFAKTPILKNLAWVSGLPLSPRNAWYSWSGYERSALVNIRRKALLSSVGFRKRMTSLSPRGSLFDSCKLRFDRPLWFVLWSDVCFEVLSCFFDHPSIESTKKMPLHLFGKDVLMFRLDQAS